MSKESIKIYFETGGSMGHNVRGIGVHTSQLIAQMKVLQSTVHGSLFTEKRSEANLVHFTYFKPFENSIVPLFKTLDQKWVLTIHDLIALIYPKHYPPGIKGAFRYKVNKYKVRKNIDAIITISETSKKDICRFLEIDPKKIYVAYLAPKKEYKKITDPQLLVEVRNKYKLPRTFIVYYGDINYNKNIPTLINACDKLNIPLVIAGKQAGEIENMDLNHAENMHLKSVYRKIINKHKVIRTGFVSDKDANAMLNLATVCVQPSYYEGFGLSVTHAFASGCPVISAKTQALVEIGGEACVYFDPESESNLTEKIKLVVSDSTLRSELINKGFDRAKDFSWEKCAQETISIYEKILKS